MNIIVRFILEDPIITDNNHHIESGNRDLRVTPLPTLFCYRPGILGKSKHDIQWYLNVEIVSKIGYTSILV